MVSTTSKLRKSKLGTPKARGPVLFLRMPDYLEAALQAFIDAQLVPPDRTAVAVAALEGYFRKHGYLPPSATRKPSA